MTNMPLTQGVASLALGYALLGFQPVVHYRRQNYAEKISILKISKQ